MVLSKLKTKMEGENNEGGRKERAWAALLIALLRLIPSLVNQNSEVKDARPVVS